MPMKNGRDNNAEERKKRVMWKNNSSEYRGACLFFHASHSIQLKYGEKKVKGLYLARLSLKPYK